jgi:hypothetical protein
MNLRPKYSLKFLLLIATAVTVFIGLSQIRRKQTLEVCDSLRKDGYVFETPNGLLDKVVWQRKPTVGNVVEVDPHTQILLLRDGSFTTRWFILSGEVQ